VPCEEDEGENYFLQKEPVVLGAEGYFQARFFIPGAISPMGSPSEQKSMTRGE